MSQVDFGRTAADYARHRAGFPRALPERLAALGALRPGARALDVGTGAGTLVRWLAAFGARAVGLDPALPLLREGRALDAAGGLEGRPETRSEVPSDDRLAGPTPVGGPWLGRGVVVTHLCSEDAAAEHTDPRRHRRTLPRVGGRAEALPFAGGRFDLVTAGQCWHWFDRPRAAAEARRVLRPGGALVIAHYDWVPRPGNVVDAMERLVLAHNPAWRGAGTTGLYPAWLGDVDDAGFERLETFSLDVPAVYTHEAWRGRVRACAGVGASLPAEGVARFDREHAALLAERFPHEPLVVPHRLWALVAWRP